MLVTPLVITVCRYNYDLKYKHDNFFLSLKIVLTILYIKFCLGLFFYATSTFVFLQLEPGSDKNTLELSNKVLSSETILNHVNTKAMRVLIVCYYHITDEFQSESTLNSLPECQETPCSKQAPYLKFKWQQRDSDPQPLSS